MQRPTIRLQPGALTDLVANASPLVPASSDTLQPLYAYK
jgi:hypothetical protein